MAVCDVICPLASVLPGGKFVWQQQYKLFASLVTALTAVIGWLRIYLLNVQDTSPNVVTIYDYHF